jgi:hypothetical protein
MADYVWRENLACVATYKILEGDKFLDEFEDADYPFDKAADLTMGRLNYYPKTTTNPDIIKMLALETARAFIKHLVKTYTVWKEDDADTSAAIILAIAKVFEGKDNTLTDLAEVVDQKIHFPDEA